MKLKKSLLLLFVLAFTMKSLAQKPVVEKNAVQTQKQVNDKNPALTQQKSVAEKNPIQSQRQDTLKNLSVRTEPALIDTLTNITLKFKPFKKSAHASYYHDKFNGKRTSSGQRFDNKNYTAAHRKFPFGTKLRVTNEKNGKFVIVEVTDRGPFSRGREIDLTKKAFMEIADNKNSGSMSVTIEEEKK